MAPKIVTLPGIKRKRPRRTRAPISAFPGTEKELRKALATVPTHAVRQSQSFAILVRAPIRGMFFDVGGSPDDLEELATMLLYHAGRLREDVRRARAGNMPRLVTDSA